MISNIVGNKEDLKAFKIYYIIDVYVLEKPSVIYERSYI